MKNYRVRIACEVLGIWREKDEVIPLTDKQAENLAPPFGNVVFPVTEQEEKPDGGLDGPKRRDRRGAE